MLKLLKPGILTDSGRTLAFTLALFTLVNVSHAAPITKAATGTDLTAGASWGGTAPGAADVATWNSASLGTALTLDSNTSWGGIAITGALTDIGITGAGTLTLGASGIDMSTSTVNLTVANTLALGAGQTWNVNTGKTLIASGIISGGFGLTKSGAGTLTLNSLANTYNGGTVVNAGSITTNSTGNVTDTYFGTGPVIINSGATLALNRTYVGNALTLNNATVTAGNSFGSTLAGTITLTGVSTISVSGNLIVVGNISGVGGLTKSSTAFVPITGASNTYTGPTTINAGGLTFKSSLYGNDTTKWIPANITVNSGGTLAMSVGGTNEFSITQAGLMFSQLGGTVNNNGLRAGSVFGIDTTNATSFNGVLSNILTDSTGTGGGAVGFRYSGAGTLELTGSNTYSGQTVVDRNGFLKVSSLNSVNGGSPPLASSSIGRPTTVANGTIQLGTSATFTGASLIYTGTGETTDRILSMGGGGNDTYRLDQSGTGILSFTSNLAMTDTRGTKTIVLQGSTAGTGEMAGVIPNATTGSGTAVTKSGTGTWSLSGSNLYAGITTLSAGVLSVSTISNGGLTPTLTTTASSATVIASSTAGLSVGQTVTSSKIPAGATIATIVDSTTFTLNSGTGVTAGTSQASTIGTRSNLGFATSAAANLVFGGGTLRYTGASASTNRSYTINASTTATFDVTANNLTLSGTSTATNGALTKTGAGTLTLAGANLATGITTVNGGTLAITGTTLSTSVAVNNTGRLLVQNTAATGTAPVTVNSGGSLGGTGSISGNVTINNGGSITLGATGSTLSLASATSPTFAAFGSLRINATSNTLDRVFLTNASANFACGNLDLVIDTTGLPRAFSAVEIVRTTKSNGVTGTFRSVSVIGDPSYTASVAYTGNSITLTLSGGSSTLPSAYKIQVAGNSSATTTAGTGVNLSITALDSFGATLTAFNGDGALSFYGLATSPNSTAATVSDKTGLAKNATLLAATPNTTLTFVNGIATTSASNNGVLTPSTAAVSTVHCYDGFVSSASGLGASGLSLTVNPTAIDSYTVTAASPQGTAAPFATTVTAKDLFGNTVTSDNSTVVTLTSSTGNAQFDSDGNGTYGDNTKTLASGAFNITTKDDVTETVTLTATSSGGKTGTSSTITIATSSAKDILTFTFPTLGAANISGTNITLTVPFGTSLNLAPTYTLSTLATCSPTSGSTQNFSTPQTYTVTAQDLSTKAYTVTLTVAPEATTFTWNSASSGNWSVPANWTNNSGLVLAPNASGNAKYTLNFNQPGTYTPAHDLNNNFQINQLNLGATVTISGNSLAFSTNGPTLPQINQNSSSAITFSAPLVLNANLTFGGSGNGTVALSSNLSGAGSLTKSCSGNMTLTGTNSHSGGTTISTGTLTLGGTANTLMGTGTVTLASGCTLALNGNNNLTNTFVLNGGTVTNGNSFSANLNGPITFGATNTFNLSTTGNMTLGGAITGSGGLIKLGTSNGPLVLSGASSFTGPVTLSEGTIQLSSFNSISGGTATSTLGAPINATNGTIAIGSSTATATLIYNGHGETTDRVIRLAGTTGGVTINQSGTPAGLASIRGVSGQLKFTADLSIPGTAGVDNRKTLTLTSTANANIGFMPGSGEIAGSISDSIAGISAAQRTTSVTKAGPNTWILSGNNTYTGATKVQAGTLAITRSDALGSGPLDITTGAKVSLDFIGTRQVSTLTFDLGSMKPNGTYGSSASPATNKDDTRFSGLGTVTVGPLSSSPTVALVRSSGSNPSSGGASISFTATVTGNQPSGNVFFYDGVTLLGAGTLNGLYQATFTTTLLSGGSHAIAAIYPGDTNNGACHSNSIAQTVNDSRTATTTTLARTSGVSPSAFGASLAFTATVTGASPTGYVAFYDDSTLLGTIALNGSAQAILTTSGLAVGYRPITASYLGNAANAPSTTATSLFQTVSPPAGNGKLKVFILAGQSNMQGKGRVELGRDPNNYNTTNFVGGLGTLRNMLNKNPKRYSYLADSSSIANTANTTVPGWRTLPNVWVSYFTSGANASATQARKGYLDADFGNGASSGQIGPEYGFGLVAGSQLSDPVLIIKTAWGGNSLAWNFRPPSSGTTTLTNINTMRDAYNFMVADVRFILNNLGTELTNFSYNPANGYEIVGFGWHQGWNDRISAGATAEYEANMTNLIKDIRTEFGVPNLPFVIGTTSMANVDSSSQALQLVAAQKAVANPTLHPEFAGTVATIDTKAYDYGTDASPSGEGYHWNWNAESYFNIGEKMGQAMMNLLAAQSSAKDILTFSVPGQTSSTVSGSTISVTVPSGTDITSLVPDLTFSPLATATPVSGVARNFTAPQTYTVTAQNLTTKSYIVTVTVSTSPYADWASNPAQGLTAGFNDGPNDDPDKDGIKNLMEFVLGGAPMVSGQAILPSLTKSVGGVWSFEYDRSDLSLPPATTQVVEYGNDLIGWTPVIVPATTSGSAEITPGSPSDHVKVTLPNLGTQIFARLKVTQ
jgi:fibronectin-binding autotransporter adhesin